MAPICELQAGYAQILITGLGILLALMMFIEMVKTLRSGNLGWTCSRLRRLLPRWRLAILGGPDVLLMLTGHALEDLPRGGPQ